MNSAEKEHEREGEGEEAREQEKTIEASFTTA
jgi:hypothetical protein